MSASSLPPKTPTLPPPMERVIAEALKDHFVLRDIDRFFGLADAQSYWKIEPEVRDWDGERVTEALAWLQGIRHNAPKEHLRVSRSVIEQILEHSNVSDKNRRALERVITRLDQLENDPSESQYHHDRVQTKHVPTEDVILYSDGFDESEDSPIREIRGYLEAIHHGLGDVPDFDSRCSELFDRIIGIRFEIMKAEDWSRYVQLVNDFLFAFREYWDWTYRRVSVDPSAEAQLQNMAVVSFAELVNSLSAVDFASYQNEYRNSRMTRRLANGKEPAVFVAHGGRSDCWAVHKYLSEDLKLKVIMFETENRTAQQIASVLEDMVTQSSVAIAVMTAEDTLEGGQKRARQNVIHEIGLFQGRLGFDRVAMLKESNTENFSNMHGVTYIPLNPKYIQGSFHEIQEWLRAKGMID